MKLLIQIQYFLTCIFSSDKSVEGEAKRMTEYKRKKMLYILNDTVKFYSKNPRKRRSVIPGTNSCKYKYVKPNGKVTKCAVGRCLEDIKDDNIYNIIEGNIWESNHMKQGLENMFNKTPNDLFKKFYKDLPGRFWEDLQNLHDNYFLWFSNEESLKKLEASKKEIENKIIDKDGYLKRSYEK
jgi:hypothetical protein